MRFSPRRSLEESARLAAAMVADEALLSALEGAIGACVAAIVDGRKLLTCGNGGSATDANHLAEELVGRFAADRRSLPALCLSVDGAALTCIANDYGFESIFSRQVESLGEAGDVLVAFTTSGKSPNVLRAMEAARAKGIIVVGLLGKGGGPALGLCDHPLVVPSDTTARIQEAHTIFLHLICEAIDAAILRPAP
jgi:D-sedoheptulose 7-phosphate isomerase